MYIRLLGVTAGLSILVSTHIFSFFCKHGRSGSADEVRPVSSDYVTLRKLAGATTRLNFMLYNYDHSQAMLSETYMYPFFAP